MKKFFKKVKDWFIAHRPSKRRLIQVYAALLYNANIKGFVQGRIFTGGTKNLCAPGLNCYSCPGAVSACPLGALQNALSSSDKTVPFYMLGIIALFGITLARTICGFLCPVGLGQELLYKIKTPKLKKNRVTRVLSYIKYVLLVGLVVILPIMLHSPTFCKYICPAGTFGGGIGLLLHPENGDFFDSLASLFTWKFGLLVAIVVLCVFCYRAFCRFLCPLGALYGLFNRIALMGVKLDQSKCTDCGLCLTHCKMDISRVGDHECIECGECISVCPTKAISWKGSKIFLHPNAVAAVADGAEETAPAKVDLLKISEANAAVVETPVSPVANVVEERPAEVVESASQAKAIKIANSPLDRIKRRNKWLEIAAWTVASLFLAFVLIYYNFILPPDKEIKLPKDATCPQFTMQGYNGTETYSFSESEGKVVVINFWATWCTGCVAELPHFNELQENYSEDVVVLAVHGDLITEDVQPFIEKMNWGDYSVKFVQDSTDLKLEYTVTGADGKVETKTEVSDLYTFLGGKGAWPMTVIDDREGKISFTRQNSISYKDLENAVLPLIGAQDNA